MYKGISRIDSIAKRQHSWLARHYTKDRIITKQFSDRVHGSKTKALKEARRWLEEQRRLYPARPSADELAPFQRQKVRSNTGIMGISRTHDYARYDRSVKQPVFSGGYSDRGVRGCKKFFINSYPSEEEALADAIQFRREKEREMLEWWKKQKRRKVKRTPRNPQPETTADENASSEANA